MINRQRLFRTFVELHRAGDPLVLFNVWDAGSARTVAEAGAPAIATGSWSVAAVHGFGDGEALPLDLAIANAERIVAAVKLPVTIDFEGAYGRFAEAVGTHAGELAATGAIGCNFEDRVVGGDGLYSLRDQVERIAAMRAGAGADFFINARTDIFLKTPADAHRDRIGEAIERAHAYAEGGASGFFVPGLIARDLIARLCERSPLPLNVMALPGAPSTDQLADAGVARISHGPAPYRQMIAALRAAAVELYRD